MISCVSFFLAFKGVRQNAERLISFFLAYGLFNCAMSSFCITWAFVMFPFSLLVECVWWGEFYYLTRNFHGADVVTAGVSEVREAWESRRKAYTSEFLEFDPCMVRHLKPSVQWFNRTFWYWSLIEVSICQLFSQMSWCISEKFAAHAQYEKNNPYLLRKHWE